MLYYLSLVSGECLKVDGEVDNRITVRGNGGTGSRGNLILRGEGSSTRVFEIRNDYYTIEVRLIPGFA